MVDINVHAVPLISTLVGGIVTCIISFCFLFQCLRFRESNSFMFNLRDSRSNYNLSLTYSLLTKLAFIRLFFSIGVLLSIFAWLVTRKLTYDWIGVFMSTAMLLAHLMFFVLRLHMTFLNTNHQLSRFTLSLYFVAIMVSFLADLLYDLIGYFPNVLSLNHSQFAKVSAALFAISEGARILILFVISIQFGNKLIALIVSHYSMGQNSGDFYHKYREHAHSHSSYSSYNNPTFSSPNASSYNYNYNYSNNNNNNNNTNNANNYSAGSAAASGDSLTSADMGLTHSMGSAGTLGTVGTFGNSGITGYGGSSIPSMPPITSGNGVGTGVTGVAGVIGSGMAGVGDISVSSYSPGNPSAVASFVFNKSPNAAQKRMVSLSMTQRKLIKIVTKQTLLTMIDFFVILVYSVGVLLGSVKFSNNSDNMVFYVLFWVFMGIQFAMTSLTIWFSFKFANKQYHRLCGGCHRCCLKRLENIVLHKINDVLE